MKAWGALLSSVLLASGCGDVCESAAQICADERRVAAPLGDTEPVSCEGDLERHATCLEEAESCAPDVVEACWKSAASEGAAP